MRFAEQGYPGGASPRTLRHHRKLGSSEIRLRNRERSNLGNQNSQQIDDIHRPKSKCSRFPRLSICVESNLVVPQPPTAALGRARELLAPAPAESIELYP